MIRYIACAVCIVVAAYAAFAAGEIAYDAVWPNTEIVHARCIERTSKAVKPTQPASSGSVTQTMAAMAKLATIPSPALTTSNTAMVTEGTSDTPWTQIRAEPLKALEASGPPGQQFAKQLIQGTKTTALRAAFSECILEWQKVHGWVDLDTELTLDLETRDDEIKIASATPRDLDAADDSLEKCVAQKFSQTTLAAEGQPAGIRRRVIFPVQVASH